MIALLRRLRIRTRLAAVNFLLFFVVVLFLSIYYPTKQSGQARAALEARASTIVGVLAFNAHSALEFEDVVWVESLLEGLKADKDAVYSVVLRKDGSRFASKGDAGVEIPAGLKAAQAAEAVYAGDLLHVCAPIQSAGGDPIGRVIAGFSLAAIRKANSDNRRDTILVGVLLALVGFVTAAFVGRKISDPIIRMATMADSIARGNLSHPPVAPGFFQDEIDRMGNAFNAMLTSLNEISHKALDVAKGDLRVSIEQDGDLAEAFRGMVRHLHDLVKQVVEVASLINSTAAQVLASSRELEASSTEQASAVEETRRTMETLLTSADQIAQNAQEVYANAERTLETNRSIAGKMSRLSSQNQKIAETLEVIKDIADKTDLLALNAALEGTKAGEAGRGFALVAAEMRKLAENVMESVKDVRRLSADIKDSSAASALAVEGGMKLAEKTTESARVISLISQQQRSGTQQVTQSMDEITQQLGQSTVGNRQTTRAAEELAVISEKLQKLVRTFQIH